MLWMIFSRGLKIGYIDCQGMQTCYKVNFGEVFFKKKKKVEPHQNRRWWFFFHIRLYFRKTFLFGKYNYSIISSIDDEFDIFKKREIFQLKMRLSWWVEILSSGGAGDSSSFFSAKDISNIHRFFSFLAKLLFLTWEF